MTEEEVFELLATARTRDEWVNMAIKLGVCGSLIKCAYSREVADDDEDHPDNPLSRGNLEHEAYEEYHRHGKVTTVRCPKCHQIIEITPLKGEEHRVKCGCDNFDFIF